MSLYLFIARCDSKATIIDNCNGRFVQTVFFAYIIGLWVVLWIRLPNEICVLFHGVNFAKLYLFKALKNIFKSLMKNFLYH